MEENVPLVDAEDQNAIIDVLKQALEQAEAGNIAGVGVAVVMRGGFSHAFGGRRPGDLYLACADMMDEIKAGCRAAKQAAAKPKRAPLIRLR